MTSILASVLFAWSLFGTPEKAPSAPPPPDADAVAKAAKAAADAAVKEITAQAVREAAEKAAADASAAKEAKEHAEKLRVEARADAEKLRTEAREDAAKERAEARADAEKAKAEAKEAAEKEKAEREESRKQIDTRIFRLRHASAEEVAESFNKMWSGDFGVNWKVTKMAVAFPESNSIMVTAPRLILDACEKSLEELDVEAQQVYIEARFVELGNTASHKVGIDWQFLDGVTMTGNMEGGYKSFRLGEGVQNYTYAEGSGTPKKGATSYTLTSTSERGDYDGNIGFFNGTLSFSQMAMTLSALDASGDTKTFSNPKIIVSSGKKAVVDMTTKYPNVKISAKRTTGVSDSLDIAANMEAIPGEDKFMFAREAFFSWGLSLEGTPRIGTNGLINVSIVPTISSLEGWVETGMSSGGENGTVSSKYPQIKVQRLITEFNLASGTTAVIGGLSITEEEQQDTGIPVLREIPWIGTRLFGSMARVKVQKEIVVFVTVGLVNPRVIHENAGLPKNAVLGRQYTMGQKLEPGDRPEKNMEGFDSLDVRPLEEQARDPLHRKKDASGFYIPFRKDPNYTKEEK